MYRILFSYGSIVIYSYGALIALGIIAGFGLSHFIAKRKGKYAQDVLDFAFYGVIAGLIGARVAYVLPRWDFYSHNPLSLFAIWQGGLAIQGAVIGGLLAAIYFAASRKIAFWDFADIMAPGLILGQAIGRIGCFFNGCSFGKPTTLLFGLVFPAGTDAHSRFGAQPLYPTQLMEFTWDLGILAALMIVGRKPQRSGNLFLLYVTLYSLGTAIIRSFRADGYMISGLSAGQYAGFAAVAIGIAVLIYRNRPSRQTQAIQSVKS